MSRWEPDAAVRLERAALELFAERGFAETTVPQITERAGLTTRTFFRHFTDKREVLFAAERDLPAYISDVMASAPDGLSPMQLVSHGLRAATATRFNDWRPQLLIRRSVIRSDEGLRERELAKGRVLAAAIDAGLRARGVPVASAGLLADIAVTIFNTALDRWLDGDDRPLADIVGATADELQRLVSS
ncbi:AcrR family transcriptional regulator [Microbacterium endophyticum]|uniref:AcrR family transcriptional regulator n=1 Tax=Microbacterium endophyticum TaxID=1526412 RepID=A0A7W4YMK7_9MICO|nr:TetR family transcriptional regulator [Microbacterium endophyticum]MBB2975241.1 AcrR family transcriptional regulator [Microbacterium endophyticum]MBB2976570.1 AcrR family transcriptional regulator [Microbacterium endophyticum]NIK37547.1 AcrR family transcriptional regulator [Microbacterium endophyticum]